MVTPLARSRRGRAAVTITVRRPPRRGSTRDKTSRTCLRIARTSLSRSTRSVGEVLYKNEPRYERHLTTQNMSVLSCIVSYGGLMISLPTLMALFTAVAMATFPRPHRPTRPAPLRHQRNARALRRRTTAATTLTQAAPTRTSSTRHDSPRRQHRRTVPSPVTRAKRRQRSATGRNPTTPHPTTRAPTTKVPGDDGSGDGGSGDGRSAEASRHERPPRDPTTPPTPTRQGRLTNVARRPPSKANPRRAPPECHPGQPVPRSGNGR